MRREQKDPSGCLIVVDCCDGKEQCAGLEVKSPSQLLANASAEQKDSVAIRQSMKHSLAAQQIVEKLVSEQRQIFENLIAAYAVTLHLRDVETVEMEGFVDSSRRRAEDVEYKRNRVRTSQHNLQGGKKRV